MGRNCLYNRGYPRVIKYPRFFIMTNFSLFLQLFQFKKNNQAEIILDKMYYVLIFIFFFLNALYKLNSKYIIFIFAKLIV